MLTRKRQTDNGYGKQDAEHQVYTGCIQAPGKQPYDIEQGSKAAVCILPVHYFFAKRPKHQSCYFKALQSPGYTYEREA